MSLFVFVGSVKENARKRPSLEMVFVEKKEPGMETSSFGGELLSSS